MSTTKIRKPTRVPRESSRLNKNARIVIKSLEDHNQTRCIDLYNYENGTFSFEVFRRDPEDPMGWRSIVPIKQPSFKSYEKLLTYLNKEYPEMFDWEIKKQQNRMHCSKTSYANSKTYNMWKTVFFHKISDTVSNSAISTQKRTKMFVFGCSWIALIATRPREGRRYFFFVSYSTPTSSFTHRSSTKASSGFDRGNPKNVRQFFGLEVVMTTVSMLLPDVRYNGLEVSEPTSHFSEQTYLNQEKELLFVTFCVPFSPIKTASYCF